MSRNTASLPPHDVRFKVIVVDGDRVRVVSPRRWPSLPTLLLLALALAVVAALTVARWFTTVLSWTAASALLAAFGLRWLRPRTALLAVVCFSSMLAAWNPGLGVLRQAAPVTAAMLCFALANVPGKRPLASARWAGLAFYIAFSAAMWTGWAAIATVVLGCGLYLAFSADAHGPRFFLHRDGMIVLAACIAARLLMGVPPQDEAAWFMADLPTATLAAWHSLVWGTLPWAPLAAATALVGLWQGHYATAIWRFLACWIVAGCLAGLCGPATAAGNVLAPLALMAAAGLHRLLARRWRRDRSPHPTTPEPWPQLPPA